MPQFCLVCREIVDKRFKIHIENGDANSTVDGYVCRWCWHRFTESAAGKGFGIAKIKHWIKGRRRPELQ